MSVPGSLAGAEIEATVASLKRHLEAVREHEVKRMRGRLGQLNSAQKNAIESLTHSIIDRILETPINVLKVASRDEDSDSVIEIVRRIFSLGKSTRILPWQPANDPRS